MTTRRKFMQLLGVSSIAPMTTLVALPDSKTVKPIDLGNAHIQQISVFGEEFRVEVHTVEVDRDKQCTANIYHHDWTVVHKNSCPNPCIVVPAHEASDIYIYTRSGLLEQFNPTWEPDYQDIYGNHGRFAPVVFR